MNEVGNAKDLATSEDIRDCVTRLGEIYQPSWREPPPAQRNPPVKTNSASPMGFDNRVAHFGLHALYAAQPAYAPNEPDLQTPTLNDTLANLRAKNTAVSNSANQLSNARLARNQTLYHDTNGLVKTALAIKRYLKSVFGATSPQYKQISGLKFTEQAK